MARDNKYGTVTTEFGSIGKNEPVVIFRAQDKLLPKLLKIYRIMCELAGTPDHHLEAIDTAAKNVKDWQAAPENLVRLPNSDEYIERISK